MIDNKTKQHSRIFNFAIQVVTNGISQGLTYYEGKAAIKACDFIMDKVARTSGRVDPTPELINEVIWLVDGELAKEPADPLTQVATGSTSTH